MQPDSPDLRETPRRLKNNKGLALITVLSLIAMITLLIVAMFGLSNTERSSASKFSETERARQLADSAISLVMSQIWSGSSQDESTAGREIWASQPGAIRKYHNNGAFHSGYRLYSSPSMIVTSSEEVMANDTPDANWSQHPSIWTDLNTPVIRPAPPSATDKTPSVIFPIIDPRAYVANGSDAEHNVEGFSYKTDQSLVSGIKPATSRTDPNARLPMPVQWIYVLQDGTLGTLVPGGESEEGGVPTYIFRGVGGLTASENNPIVGRIAFWTDDETAKININTASEPLFWTTPFLYHERDEHWSIYQPTRFEFQRYPGHPATVALSTVLFPNQDLDPYGKAPNAREEILAKRERIYEIVPKINMGGSISGTVPFWALTDSAYSGPRMHHVNLAESLKERLYASVDELLFSQEIAGERRLIHDEADGANAQNRLFGNDPERALERVRAFLTSHSRSPETNLFGMPRISLWPVADESLSNTHRTVYDNMIAWCASSGEPTSEEFSYFFRRKDSTSPTTDVNLPRNQVLLNYLYHLLSKDFPAGGNAAASFTTKYGEDAARLVTQLFDYIRSINVYDGSLAPPTDTLKNDAAYRLEGKNSEWILNNIPPHRTYTADRGSQPRNSERIIDRAFPGHGMVAPSHTQVAGVDTRGQGRFPALSEIGLLFICTADGTNDEGSFRFLDAEGKIPEPTNEVNDTLTSGGRTSPKIALGEALAYDSPANSATEDGPYPTSQTGDPVTTQYWYSNFPPFPAPNRYGTNASANANDPRHPAKHPGYQPQNWNATLDTNTPLLPGERRVQGVLTMEFTNIAPGWGGMMPNFCVELEGLENLTIENTIHGSRPLFSAASRKIWRSGGNIWSGNNVHMIGGSISPTITMSGRRLPAMGNMPADPGYATDAMTNPNKGNVNFDLVTEYHTIPGPIHPTVSEPHRMILGGNGPLTLKVYTGQDPKPENLVQIIEVDFRIDKNGVIAATRSVPTPELVRAGVGSQIRSDGNPHPRCEAPHWWAFHYAGALQRWTGTWNAPTVANITYASFSSTATDAYRRTLGRFYHNIDAVAAPQGIPRYQQLTWMMNTNNQFTYPYSELEVQNTGPLPKGLRGPFGQDTLVNLVSRHSDLRLLNAKFHVPATDWRPHPRLLPTDDPNWVNPDNKNLPVFVAHTWSRYGDYVDPGFVYEINPENGRTIVDRTARLVKFGPNGGYKPDVPLGTHLAHRYRDFDNSFGAGNMRDGPWINWPDEGNIGVDYRTVSGGTYRIPSGYHGEPWRSASAGFNYMTPNRLMPSAVMFGSLPASPTTGGPDGNGDPWRTLLFRPNTIPAGGTSAIGAEPHPGAPSYYGGIDPADHYLLDLFWMPIVEPYAISEPYSTAGKVNLNYQMVPFNKYIRRATGMHAVLKGEMMHAIPTDAMEARRKSPSGTQLIPFELGYGNYHHHQLWTDIEANLGNYSESPKLRFWHRKILADKKEGETWEGTLGQFERRFEFADSGVEGTPTDTPTQAKGLFRTASQICEIHLIPQKITGSAPVVVTSAANPPASEGGDPNPEAPYNTSEINTFWEARAITGDNARERPYAHIYQKVTTQSNTFRVHYRAQAIRKARSVDSNQFNPQLDSVTADYRGSALIERRIQPKDPEIPDYANPSNYEADPLDHYYKFRVLENKRFAP